MADLKLSFIKWNFLAFQKLCVFTSSLENVNVNVNVNVGKNGKKRGSVFAVTLSAKNLCHSRFSFGLITIVGSQVSHVRNTMSTLKMLATCVFRMMPRDTTGKDAR